MSTETEQSPAAPVVTVTLDTPIGWGYDGDGDRHVITIADAITEQVVERLHNKVGKEVHDLVRETIGEQIRTQVGDVIAEVIATPVQLTNTWGEPIGQTVSVRERIAEEVKAQLTNRRDSYGKGTVLADLIKEQVQQALRKELGASIEAARDQVVGSVRAQAAALIAQAVKDGLR